jgi:hypothetical protein
MKFANSGSSLNARTQSEIDINLFDLLRAGRPRRGGSMLAHGWSLYANPLRHLEDGS